MQQWTNRTLCLVLASISGGTSLAGCSSLPAMHDPSSYAQMDCSQLQQERDAVSQNESSSRESSSFGFVNIIGALAEGAAIGTGDTATAATQHSNNADYESYQQQQAGNADAYAQRMELLDKVIAARQCNVVANSQ